MSSDTPRNKATLLKRGWSASIPMMMRPTQLQIDKRKTRIPEKESSPPMLWTMVDILLMTNRPQPVVHAKEAKRSQKSNLVHVLHVESESSKGLTSMVLLLAMRTRRRPREIVFLFSSRSRVVIATDPPSFSVCLSVFSPFASASSCGDGRTYAPSTLTTATRIAQSRKKNSRPTTWYVMPTIVEQRPYPAATKPIARPR
mmetsp:Transcript_41767/g.77281  ORF Transcript_41767/g.77281 Transcript_41767/m.77281 type:complete len:200 (-) Transcript_41767:559-1158(-)